MELIQLEQNLRDAVNKISSTGKEYAEAKALSWQMQEMKKVVLSKIMDGLEGSIAEREMKARTSARYIMHLEGTKEAIEKELKARAIFERYKAQYEAARSLLSLEKAKVELR